MRERERGREGARERGRARESEGERGRARESEGERGRARGREGERERERAREREREREMRKREGTSRMRVVTHLYRNAYRICLLRRPLVEGRSGWSSMFWRTTLHTSWWNR